ncbi:hypothetical protein ABW19_dt0203862 [Dactylella cylindrospora]|nr:hypothetical protein ABW19_dt0203862 [Dactylella cylindrospora]
MSSTVATKRTTSRGAQKTTTSRSTQKTKTIKSAQKTTTKATKTRSSSTSQRPTTSKKVSSQMPKKTPNVLIAEDWRANCSTSKTPGPGTTVANISAAMTNIENKIVGPLLLDDPKAECQRHWCDFNSRTLISLCGPESRNASIGTFHLNSRLDWLVEGLENKTGASFQCGWDPSKNIGKYVYGSVQQGPGKYLSSEPWRIDVRHEDCKNWTEKYYPTIAYNKVNAGPQLHLQQTRRWEAKCRPELGSDKGYLLTLSIFMDGYRNLILNGTSKAVNRRFKALSGDWEIYCEDNPGYGPLVITLEAENEKQSSYYIYEAMGKWLAAVNIYNETTIAPNWNLTSSFADPAELTNSELYGSIVEEFGPVRVPLAAPITILKPKTESCDTFMNELTLLAP